MNTHYEIERKFLVKYPELPLPFTISVSHIVQTYLLAQPGVSERVRDRDGKYYHTRKVRISGARAEDSEGEISRERYEELLIRRDPTCRDIEKDRHVFDYKGQIFELDIFPFWRKQAMLEIELPDEGTPIDFPPFLTVLREVTDDPAYKNHSMARNILPED